MLWPTLSSLPPQTSESHILVPLIQHCIVGGIHTWDVWCLVNWLLMLYSKTVWWAMLVVEGWKQLFKSQLPHLKLNLFSRTSNTKVCTIQALKICPICCLHLAQVRSACHFPSFSGPLWKMVVLKGIFWHVSQKNRNFLQMWSEYFW